MQHDTPSSQAPAQEKKPYAAPKLVEIGDAAEMTQLTIGPASDAALLSTLAAPTGS